MIVTNTTTPNTYTLYVRSATNQVYRIGLFTSLDDAWETQHHINETTAGCGPATDQELSQFRDEMDRYCMQLADLHTDA